MKPIDNEVGAAAATGRGEKIARICSAFSIVDHFRRGLSPQEACEAVVRHLTERVPTSRPYQMAYIAINNQGEYGAAAAQKPFPFAVTNAEENQIHEGKWILETDST